MIWISSRSITKNPHPWGFFLICYTLKVISDNLKPKTILNLEQIKKIDADLKTISSLFSFAASINSVLEVTGGYAAEAHFGGKITRPHGDIDLVFWLRSADFEKEAQRKIYKILEAEETNWRIYNDSKEKFHFIEFREENPSISKFKDRRRIEMYTFDRKRMRPLIKKVLVDSEGKKHDVMIAPIEMTVANIIRIINRTEEEKVGKRETQETDINELKRLISHESFTKDKYLSEMTGFIIHKTKESGKAISVKKAKLKAEDMWNKAMDLINYSSSLPA